MVQRRDTAGSGSALAAPETWLRLTADVDPPQPGEDDDMATEPSGSDGDGDRRYMDL
jgi:hypothetical protein